MLKSNLCDYSDACILVKGTITINNTAATAAAAANNNNDDTNKKHLKIVLHLLLA